MIQKLKLLTVLGCMLSGMQLSAQDVFPDGTPVSAWFSQNKTTDVNSLGRKYIITEHGVVNDSTLLQTEKIQAVIDRAHQTGGGVIVIPRGTFLSGSLFFKPGTHLHLDKDGVLKGSDDISHFKIVMTRMEGQTLKYFAALVNADKVDGFTISGHGTINGNGLRYWKAFWLRREFNRQCTNMDEMRPRLVYISNSNDVQLSDVRLKDSPFWTTHFYKCNRVKLLNLHITSPESPVKAPSTDAVDIDACTDFLIKNCYMSVNDDAISLKGGKGLEADKDPNNGANKNIIIEDCNFGFCHSSLTCGSEAIHCRNVILRNCTVDGARIVLHLKMRPDTPQRNEYILVENVTGAANCMIRVHPWSQFAKLKGENDFKISCANNITMRNLKLKCDMAFNIKESDQYKLSDFTFENISIQEDKESQKVSRFINGAVFKNVTVNGKEY